MQFVRLISTSGDGYAQVGAIGLLTLFKHYPTAQLRMWINFGHNYVIQPDGSPMYVVVKDNAEESIATGTIAASTECIEKSVNGYATRDQRDQHCRSWGYTDLSSTIDLIEGSKYSVEFTASRSAGFALSTHFSLSRYGSTSINHWNNAQAEFSTNNGRSWSAWTQSAPHRDLALLFTIEGMPKSLD